MRTFMRWLKLMLLTCTLLGIAGALSAEAHRQYGTVGLLRMAGINIPVEVRTETREVERVVEMEKEEVTFRQALAERMKRATVPDVLVRGILYKESRGAPDKMDQSRFEDSYMAKAGRWERDPANRHPWASSWCPFHIMAPHVVDFGYKTWSVLLQPEICVEIGMSLLEKCWKDSGALGADTPAEFELAVINTGKCYQGGLVYGRSLAEYVAREAIKEYLSKNRGRESN